MNRKFASGILLFASVMTLGSETASSLQQVAQAKPPVIFTTAPKVINAQLKLADGFSSIVAGRTTFTVVQANEDDTMTGILVYELPVKTRKKLAEASGAALSLVPAIVSLKDVKASFKRGSACPQIKLLVEAKNAEASGAQLLFDRVVLNINETPEQMNQLFCSWTRQINVKRQRQGIIAAINRLLVPSEAAEEAVENKPVKP